MNSLRSKWIRTFSTFPMPESDLPRTRLIHTPESFLIRASKDLKDGDLRQSTDNLWAASSLALEQAALKLGYQTKSRIIQNRLFFSLVKQCDILTIHEMNALWNTAQLCHQNFYDNFMDAEQVNYAGFQVQTLVEKIRLLDSGKFDKQLFEDGLSEYERSKL